MKNRYLIYFIITGLFLGSFFGALTHNVVNASPTWYDTDWQYCKKIIIDHTKVISNLGNFPILFVNTSLDFKNHAQSDGDDFIFVKVGNATKYNHEIESYDSNIGKLVAWVNITFLSSTVDTVIYLYYGNSLCSSQQNRYGTWNSNYVIVSHFAETLGTNILDSTSNHFNGTAKNSPTLNQTGKFGTAIYFDGVNDYVEYGDNDAFTVPSSSYEFILKPSAQTKATPFLLSKESFTQVEMGISFLTAPNSIAHDVYESGTKYIGRRDTNGKDTIGLGWSSLNCLWSGGVIDTAISIYINDSQTDDLGEDVGVFTGQANTNALFLLCADGYNVANYIWTGYIDEFRFSKIKRNTSWLTTGYNNQMYLSTFLSVGNEYTPFVMDIIVITDFLPIDNTVDVCPCCIIFGVTVSDTVNKSMTLTFSNNYTGDFEIISNVHNGTYYFCLEYLNTFNRFNMSYDWWVTVVSSTNSTTSDFQHFITTNDINCSSSINAYTKNESDNLFLSSLFDITPNLLFLGMCLSLWLFFIEKSIKYSNDVMLNLMQFCISFPLSISIIPIAMSYPLGYGIIFLIPTLSLVLLYGSLIKNRKEKKK